MDTNEENESPPVRGQYNQDQDHAIDLDDDTDFVEETRVRARTKTPSHRHSLKGKVFLNKLVQVLQNTTKIRSIAQVGVKRVRTLTPSRGALNYHPIYRM